MQSVNVSEVNGLTLDWLVAKCENHAPFSDGISWITVLNGKHVQLPKFSTDWALAGPIIERENLNVERSNMFDGWFASQQRHTYAADSRRFYADGPTPLIAAMRCYVISKLGDTATVPAELIANK